jgi:glutamine synthetase
MTPTATDHLDEAGLADFLGSLGVHNLLLTMVDQAGITRVKLLPVERVPSAVRRGVGFSLTSALLLCSDDSIAEVPEFPVARGDVRLFADANAIRMIDVGTGLAWAPADQFTPEGKPFSVCQRNALDAQTQHAETVGLRFHVAFEVEFTLFTGTREHPQLAHVGPAYGLAPILGLEAWATDLLSACRVAGIEIEQLHPEYGNGQMELSLKPRDPRDAVDEYLATRLVVSRVAAEHGMLVSFAPISTAEGIGNGCHVHFSVLQDGQNVFADSNEGTGMKPIGEQLIAGMVTHLPAATALLAPSVSSYDRLQPGQFSGAFACWGIENREAAVRYIPGVAGRRNSGANVEVKTPDGTANPYLAVAAIIACATEGVIGGYPLPDGVTDIPTSATQLRLPHDLPTALSALDKSTFLRERLGDSLINSYLAVRGREWDVFGSLSKEERVAQLRWKN